MNLRNVARLFGHWLWLIVLAAALTGWMVRAVMIRNGLLPQYSAEAVIAVGGDAYRDVQDTTYVEMAAAMMANYLEVAKMGIVTNAVAAQIDQAMTADEITRALDVSAIEGTNLIAIRMTHSDPVLAAEIANGVARQLATLAPARWVNFVMMIEAAEVPVEADAFAQLPVILSSIVVALLVGAVVLFREFIRDPIYNEEDARAALGLPIVAVLEPVPFAPAKSLGIANWIRGGETVWWSLLETCKRELAGRMEAGQGPFMLLTSPHGETSCAFAALQLARCWAAEVGASLLVDADFNRQETARLGLNIRPATGLAELFERPLTNLGDLILRNPDLPGVSILPAGNLQSSTSITQLKAGLDSFLGQRDNRLAVVVSAPKVDASIMTLLIANQSDVNFLVIEAGRTLRTQARRSITLLTANDIRVQGIILSYVSPWSVRLAIHLKSLLRSVEPQYRRLGTALRRLVVERKIEEASLEAQGGNDGDDRSEDVAGPVLADDYPSELPVPTVVVDKTSRRRKPKTASVAGSGGVMPETG